MRIGIRAVRSALASWLLVLIIAGYPAMAVVVELVGVESTIITQPYRAIVAMLAVGLICTGFLVPLTGYLRFSLAFFLIFYLFRLVYDSSIGQHPDGPQALVFFIVATLVPMLAIAFLLDHNFSDKRFAKQLLWTAFFTLLGYNFLTSFGFLSVDAGVRASLNALNPISLGHLAATACLVGVYAIVNGPGLFYAIAAASMILLSMPILLASGSRGPLVALMFGIFWLTLSNKKRFAQMVPILLLSAMYVPRENLIFERFAGVLGDFDASVLIRLRLQISALNDMLAAPLTGRHFLDPEFGMGYWPHNFFLEAGMALGFLGLIVSLYLFFSVFVVMLRYLSKDYLLLSAMLVQYLAAAQFSGSIWGADKLLALTAAAFAIGRSRARSSKQRDTASASTEVAT